MVLDSTHLMPLGVGFVGGIAVAGLIYWGVIKRLSLSTIWHGATWSEVAIGCLVVASLLGAALGQLPFTHAALIILFGSVAFLAAGRVMASLERGETIELQGHWGGLGGALGGWRVSPTTGLVLLTLAFAGAAVGIAASIKTGETKTTGSEQKAPAAEKKDTQVSPAPASPSAVPPAPPSPSSATPPAAGTGAPLPAQEAPRTGSGS
jgi:hypothetical protein